MRILVTGSSGMMGSHLMEALKGHQLLGVDIKKGIDVASSQFIGIADTFEPEMIVHLAAFVSAPLSIKYPPKNFNDNVLATFNVCEVARKHKAKVLYMSSCKANPNEFGARSQYGLAKLIGELYLKEYRHDYGIEWIINRPSTVYGPRQNGTEDGGFFTWFIKASLDKYPITIFGKGDQVRDVLYVDDFVKLLVDQIENWKLYKLRTYQIGGGKENSMTLLEYLKFLKYDNYTFGEKRIGDVKVHVSDNKAVSSIKGWKPTTSYKEGTKKFIQWYKR